MSKIHKITDVIFDLDGTLVDSAPGILFCLAKALSSQGIVPNVPLTQSIIGPPLHETLCKISGCSDEKLLAEMALTFVTNYDLNGFLQTNAFDGIQELLQKLTRMHVRLYIATNKRLKPTRLILERLGWSDFFRAVYTQDLSEPSFISKTEMLGALLSNEAIAASQAIYVGDRWDDFQAAKYNSISFIAATWGYHDESFMINSASISAVSHPAKIVNFVKGQVS